MFVDSHCHLDRLKLSEEELDKAVLEAKLAGVEHILCVAVSVKEYEQMLAKVCRFDNVSTSCGVHPLHQEDACSASELLKYCSRDEVVAVGETGLDYFYSEDTKSVQLTSFVDHINTANTLNKPLIIHTRSAQEDTLALLESHYKETTGAVLHCFTESLEMARAAMDMGIYISISGIVTFNSAKELQETVKEIPIEKLLIETDSPWLAPVPYRGKENQPKHVVDVAKFIAELKGIPLELLAEQTSQNFYTLFNRVTK